MRVQSPSGSERVGGQLACRCAMFKLLRVSVLVGALPLSLWLPHCSQNTGSLSPATTCKLPRDLTSRVLHRELAERTEAVNVPHTGARAAIDIIRPAVLALGKIRGDIMVWANFKSEKSEFKIWIFPDQLLLRNATDLFPGPAGGSDVLDLFLLSESSDKAKGFTLALQPWALVCRRTALRSGQSLHYWVSAVSSVGRAGAFTWGTVRRTWCGSCSLLVWKHK